MTGLRVLIVDDHPDAAASFGLIVQAAGHSPQVCTTAAEALAQFHTFRPHVVLLDLRMPEMDGFTLARRLREASVASHPALIAITGYDGDEQRCKAAFDFDFYFRKPVEPKVLQGLLAAVRGLIAEDTGTVE